MESILKTYEEQSEMYRSQKESHNIESAIIEEEETEIIKLEADLAKGDSELRLRKTMLAKRKEDFNVKGLELANTERKLDTLTKVKVSCFGCSTFVPVTDMDHHVATCEKRKIVFKDNIDVNTDTIILSDSDDEQGVFKDNIDDVSKLEVNTDTIILSDSDDEQGLNMPDKMKKSANAGILLLEWPEDAGINASKLEVNKDTIVLSDSDDEQGLYMLDKMKKSANAGILLLEWPEDAGIDSDSDDEQGLNMRDKMKKSAEDAGISSGALKIQPMPQDRFFGIVYKRKNRRPPRNFIVLEGSSKQASDGSKLDTEGGAMKLQPLPTEEKSFGIVYRRKNKLPPRKFIVLEASKHGADASRQGADASRQGADASRQGADASRQGADVSRQGADPGKEDAEVISDPSKEDE